MIRIIAISGSLRRASFNTALLRAAQELTPPECRVELASIEGIPLYDGDAEATQGVPAAVAQLKERLAVADGMLLATPEYNNSIPGVLKNAIDWLSRPPEDIPRVFGGLPVGLVGATSGLGGTRLSQTAWLAVFRTLGMQPWFGQQLYVDKATESFDAAGRLTNDKLRGRLAGYIVGFTQFVDMCSITKARRTSVSPPA